MEASHLSKCKMSSSTCSNIKLEIILKSIIRNMRIIFYQWKKNWLNNHAMGSKKLSGIKLTKEIFEWKPVNYRNVKCRHLAIVIWKSF